MRVVISIFLYTVLIGGSLLIWGLISIYLESHWNNQGKSIYVGAYIILFLVYQFLIRLSIHKQPGIFLLLFVWIGFPSVTSHMTNTGVSIQCKDEWIVSADEYRRADLSPYGISVLHLVFQNDTGCDENEAWSVFSYRIIHPVILKESVIYRMHLITVILISFCLRVDWIRRIHNLRSSVPVYLKNEKQQPGRFYFLAGVLAIGWSCILMQVAPVQIEDLVSANFIFFLTLFTLILCIGIFAVKSRLYKILLLLLLAGSFPTISTYNLQATIGFLNCYNDSERTYTESNPYTLLYMTTFGSSIVDLQYGIQKDCKSEHRKLTGLNFIYDQNGQSKRLIHVLSILITGYFLYLLSWYCLWEVPKGTDLAA